MAVTASRRAHTKVSRDDWIRAGVTALTTKGIDQVKVLSLAKHLEVSRSSFYWYFGSRRELLDELLAAWRVNTSSIVERTARRAPTIVAAVLGVFECWADNRLFDPDLDFAVRDWARRDQSVKAKVEAADQVRLDAIVAMYREYQYGVDDSTVRARLLYQGQVGYYAVGTNEPTAARLGYLPYYLRALTGTEATSSELEAFEGFHASLLKDVRPLRAGSSLVTPLMKGRPMKVHVDQDLCQGHNRCYMLAPELFDVDDYGNAFAISDDDVPAELEHKAQLAVDNCPEYAVKIIDK